MFVTRHARSKIAASPLRASNQSCKRALTASHVACTNRRDASIVPGPPDSNTTDNSQREAFPNHGDLARILNGTTHNQPFGSALEATQDGATFLDGPTNKSNAGETREERSATKPGGVSAEYRSIPHVRRIEGFLQPSDGKLGMQDLVPPSQQKPIARLSHGLDRALFNPGVYWLQDPRSHVYNFTPWLQNIPKIQDFAFERLDGFVPSSADNDLQTLAKQTQSKYTGSTSSLTGMLSQIYLTLSREKAVDTSVLSQAFSRESKNFTPGQKLPVSTRLNYSDGIYSTDSNPLVLGKDDKNVLSWMGTMLEKFMTMSEAEFKLLLHNSPASPREPDNSREAFRFVQAGNYVMRSQLDCYDPRLPGTGVFDLKTRAALPIRYDIMNYEANSVYFIHQQHGREESFEREYYDMIRSAFLKYSFQARIGDMDGVLVAYHNTARIFGFQYIPLTEMDERLYGNKLAGPQIFAKCLELLQVISDEITYHYPEQTINCLWDSEPADGILKIWVRPHSWQGIGFGPITELTIEFNNFLDDQPVHAHEVASQLPWKAWTVQYEIRTSSATEDEIRRRYQAAIDKQIYIWDLPSGVDINEMAELWEQMAFGGDNASQTEFRPEMWRRPGQGTKRLRKLAQKGRVHMDRIARESEGKPVVVYDSYKSS